MMNRREVASPPSWTPVDDQVRSLLLLSMIPGLGPRTLRSLLEHFSSADLALAADGAALGQVIGVGPKLVHAIRHASHYVDVESILDWCSSNETRILCRGTADYPSLLEQVADAPPI